MKTALITGTTSGIGEAFCHLLASKNYNLILVARNKVKLEQQVLCLEKKNIKVISLPCDLAEQNAAKYIYDTLASDNVVIDILINNAGFNEAGYFADTNLSRELDMIQVHIRTLTELTKLFLPGMIAQGYGRILNLGSSICGNKGLCTFIFQWPLSGAEGNRSHRNLPLPRCNPNRLCCQSEYRSYIAF